MEGYWKGLELEQASIASPVSDAKQHFVNAYVLPGGVIEFGNVKTSFRDAQSAGITALGDTGFTTLAFMVEAGEVKQARVLGYTQGRGNT